MEILSYNISQLSRILGKNSNIKLHEFYRLYSMMDKFLHLWSPLPVVI